jgi:hypothetical protein
MLPLIRTGCVCAVMTFSPPTNETPLMSRAIVAGAVGEMVSPATCLPPSRRIGDASDPNGPGVLMRTLSWIAVPTSIVVVPVYVLVARTSVAAAIVRPPLPEIEPFRMIPPAGLKMSPSADPKFSGGATLACPKPTVNDPGGLLINRPLLMVNVWLPVMLTPLASVTELTVVGAETFARLVTTLFVDTAPTGSVETYSDARSGRTYVLSNVSGAQVSGPGNVDAW